MVLNQQQTDHWKRTEFLEVVLHKHGNLYKIKLAPQNNKERINYLKTVMWSSHPGLGEGNVTSIHEDAGSDPWPQYVV